MDFVWTQSSKLDKPTTTDPILINYCICIRAVFLATIDLKKHYLENFKTPSMLIFPNSFNVRFLRPGQR